MQPETQVATLLRGLALQEPGGPRLQNPRSPPAGGCGTADLTRSASYFKSEFGRSLSYAECESQAWCLHILKASVYTVFYHDKMGSAGVQDSWASYDRVGSQEV